MYLAIGCLVISAVIGIRLAIFNLNDEAERNQRLEKRRKQRKARKRLW